MSDVKVDKELEQYRNLLDTPTSYEDGFGWTTVLGVFFCGLIMMPGSIYLGLMTGGSIGSAASWVTVILFGEVARRAMKTMSKGNLVVLLHAAGVMMYTGAGGPFGGVIYRTYLVTSDAARDMGMRDAFPAWFCPSPDSLAITERMLWHKDWLPVIGLMVFLTIIGLMKKYTLGYFFFRLCSDVEALPFPMAPISAQGAMALAESDQKEGEVEEKVDKDGNRIYSKWRIFTLGTVFGLAFGVIQVGFPAISGLFLDKPVFLLPQPFVDTTTLTEVLLPATPTGMVVDLGIILIGFVLPFWAIIGTFVAIAITLLLNPILQHLGVLSQWQVGMNTINTSFVNGIDFWISFGIGTAAAIAAISVFQTVRGLIQKGRDSKNTLKKIGHNRAEVSSLWTTPTIGRGDYPMWMALVGYIIAASGVVIVCNYLVPGILPFLIIFTFLYNPFISYVNARLLGISGQSVDIPFVREGAFILSGCQKIDIWLAPSPIENYGGQAQSFRVNELTGVNFRSLLKADLVALPVLFILSFLFWAFIWKSGAIPSDIYPAAQLNWELQAKNQTLMYSSTFVPEGGDGTAHSFYDTQFSKAIHPQFIGVGATITVVFFVLFSFLGLPTMLIYGMIRGFGGLPHTMILEIVGALVGRYYFQKRYGSSNFLRMAPTLLAGYFTGVGLIGMSTIAMTLIKNAVSAAPF